MLKVPLTSIAVGLLLWVPAAPIAAQSVTSYLKDTANSGVAIQIVIPQAVAPTNNSFFGKIRALLGIRQVTRFKPAVGTKLIVQASAYAPSPYQTDATPCVTAAGTRVRPGVVATNFLPFGTILDINGDKYIVEDRMNVRYDGYFMDIWFPSTSSALEFGRKHLDITVVGYGAPGDNVRATSETTTVAGPDQSDVSFWGKLKNQVVSIAVFLTAKVVGNPNQHDVNCAEDG